MWVRRIPGALCNFHVYMMYSMDLNDHIIRWKHMWMPSMLMLDETQVGVHLGCGD